MIVLDTTIVGVALPSIRWNPRAWSVSQGSGVELDHGFQSALYVLAALLLSGALIAFSCTCKYKSPREETPSETNAVTLEEGA